MNKYTSHNPRMVRFSSVDVARGLAIVLMIQIHVGLIYYASWPLNLIVIIFSPAQFFLIVAGLSYDLFLKSRTSQTISRTRLEVITRALILAAIGMMALLIGELVFPENYSFTYYWGTFQTIAFSYIFGLIHRNSIRNYLSIITILCILIIIGSQATIINQFTDAGLVLLSSIIYFYIGRLIYLLAYQKRNHIKTLALLSSTGSVLLFSIIFLTPTLIYSNRWNFPIIFIISSNIAFLILLIREYEIIRENKLRSHYFLKITEHIGKISLTFYYLHMIIILILVYTLKYVDANIPTLSTTFNLIITFSIVTVLYVIELSWSRCNYVFSVDWILRKISIFIVRKNAVITKT